MWGDGDDRAGRRQPLRFRVTAIQSETDGDVETDLPFAAELPDQPRLRIPRPGDCRIRSGRSPSVRDDRANDEKQKGGEGGCSHGATAARESNRCGKRVKQGTVILPARSRRDVNGTRILPLGSMGRRPVSATGSVVVSANPPAEPAGFTGEPPVLPTRVPPAFVMFRVIRG